MEILFCGTAAAEGWPALFCVCAACRGARDIGGKELRSRAAYMLGDRIRVDFGPDSNLHQQQYGLAYDKLEHLLVTHSHDDHWFVQDLGYRRKGFSEIPDRLLHVWGNEKVEQKFVAVNGSDWRRYGLEFHRIRAFESIDLGEGVTATPVLAAHDRSEECVNYVIEADGRRTLLGHDTGWYGERTWDFLSNRRLDVLVLDCTHGTEDHEPNHLGGTTLAKVRDELARRGSVTAGTVCIATHFSHNGHSLHADLEKFFAPLGFQVAYDGLRVTP
jgi:phosphoribosyl 1,2-cyclic phosphate phosphodiesterase